jgi:hypothetical protein
LLAAAGAAAATCTVVTAATACAVVAACAAAPDTLEDVRNPSSVALDCRWQRKWKTALDKQDFITPVIGMMKLRTEHAQIYFSGCHSSH